MVVHRGLRLLDPEPRYVQRRQEQQCQQRASPFKAACVAAKHGIVGLTKVTALETAQEGITCNAICRGCVYAIGIRASSS